MCESNGWKGVQMAKGDDGVWTAKISLSPGTYAYKFLVDGKDWLLDPNNSNKKSVDGIENSAIARSNKCRHTASALKLRRTETCITRQ